MSWTFFRVRLSMIEIVALNDEFSSKIKSSSFTWHVRVGSDELIGLVTTFIGSNLLLFNEKRVYFMIFKKYFGLKYKI